MFEVVHKQIKEAEDFAAIVKIAAKNLCSHVSLVKFLMNPLAEWPKEKEKELNIMQLNWFEPDDGGVFCKLSLASSEKPLN